MVGVEHRPESEVPTKEHGRDPQALTAGEWIRVWGERWSPALLAITLLSFFLQSLHASAVKGLWFDEMFTWNLAQQPTWQMFRMGLAADGNPPLLSGLNRLIALRFGAGELPMRIVPLLGYLGAALLLYRFVRVRIGGLLALMAVLLLCSDSHVAYYAVEARPYGLVLFFATLALVAWQAATDAERPRPGAKWLLTVAIAGTILSHHLAILSVGFPILCGELTRTLRRRRFDVPLIGAACVGLLPLLFTLRVIHETQGKLLSYVQHAHAFPRHFAGTDATALLDLPMRALPLVLLAVGAGLWLVGRKRAKAGTLEAQPGWPVHEAVAICASAASWILVWFVCSVTTGYFGGFRYAIASIVGLICLYVSAFRQAHAQVAAVLTAALLLTLVQDTPLHRTSSPVTSPEEGCIAALPAEPIVVSRGLSYPTAWHYANQEQRERLYFLTDVTYARHEGYNIPEMTMIVQKPLFPMRLRDYHEFLGSHSQFLLIVSGFQAQDYMVEHLRQDGARFAPLIVPACRTFTIYRVDAPASQRS